MRASASATRSVVALARRWEAWWWPKPACMASRLAFHMAGRSRLRSSSSISAMAVAGGLPGGPGGGERRLEVGELGGSLGSTVGLGRRSTSARSSRRCSSWRRHGSTQSGMIDAGVGRRGWAGWVWRARSRRWVTAGMSARSWASTRFEDVAGFGEIVGVGDDVDVVLVAAAGDADVEPAAGGGWSRRGRWRRRRCRPGCRVRWRRSRGARARGRSRRGG